MNFIVSDSAMTRKGLGKTIVVGLGLTGLSCVRFLMKHNIDVMVVDSRKNPPKWHECQKYFPEVELVTGAFDTALLSSCDQLIVSPGVPLSDPAINSAIESGVQIRGDVDLFRDYISAPLVAITGSNGKSTVTRLLGDMAIKAGIKVAVGGNLGKPVLDLLNDDVELYVVELSSFQLETTDNLSATSAVLLNLSDDHMDRYPNKKAYHQAKQRIFRHCPNVIVNDEEPLSQPLVGSNVKVIHYGMNGTDLNKYAVIEQAGEKFLAKGFSRLLNVRELKIKGRHNQSNALAALALGHSVGLDDKPMLETLQEFRGLPHRCQWVATKNGVEFINDSKGTNVGATATALESLGSEMPGSAEKSIIWIAGGEAKGADFSPLKAPAEQYVKHLFLLGKDADSIVQALGSVVDVTRVSSLNEALKEAVAVADEGDKILLSPACASFDMFKNFEHRGQVFIDEVMRL